MPLAPGDRLGCYEVVAPLGSGGMGEVYRARDVRLGREVAIKVLPEEVAADPERRARFEREARAASALNHPGIVTVHGFDVAFGRWYLVMERVEGRSLRDLLAAAPLPIGRTLDLAAGIAEALTAAHACAIVHRDLKPSNVMVGPGGRVKILDFGLAKFSADSPLADDVAADPGHTRTGIIVGTAAYMSPEQARGAPIDFRSDQFSFGAMVYEMAAGQKPFQRATSAEAMAAVLKEEPPPLGSVAPGVPGRLSDIVARCLAKDPAARYDSTADLARDLRDLVASVAEAPTKAAPAPRRRHRRTAWLAAAATALALVIGLAAPVSRRARVSSVAGRTTPSVAVLPFLSLGGAQEEYFTDGVTESIITDLARVKGLLVIARNSTFAYKGRRIDVQDIGRELGVRYVLEGSVQHVGDRLRLSAQLVDVRKGFHLWADRYDRDVKDVFGVQDEISRRVVEAVTAAVAASPEGGISVAPTVPRRPPTTNLAAYEAYLRGRYHAEQFSWTEGDKGIPWLERAVALDSGFAEAHAALAAQYARKFFDTDDREWEAKAFVAIEKALSTDPELPGPYATRGALLWTSAHGFPHEAAAAVFRRALALSPNDAEAHGQLGNIYLHVGLLDEALKECGEALRRSPGSPAWILRIGRIHLFRQQAQKALDEFGKHPEVARTSMEAALALDRVGRSPEARELLEELLGSRREPVAVTDAASAYAVILARAGESDRAEENITRALRQTAKGSHFHHAAYNIASAYAVMGRKRDAMEWLRRTAREGMPCYSLFAVDANLDSLRGDADFQAFLGEQRAQWQRFRSML